MRKVLLPLFAATFVLSAIASAESITSVTFQGPNDNPTIIIAGSGFNTEPVGDDFPGGGLFGQDFGNDASTFSIYDTGPFSFEAGQDGDTVGMTNIHFTDTLISYQL